MKLFKKIFCVLVISILFINLMGCSFGSGVEYNSNNNVKALSYDDAVTELNTLVKSIQINTVTNPKLDIYSDEISEADALADIDTFKLTVQGNGDINVEIAAATELSAESDPDNWINIIAENFNKEHFKIGNKTISVSIRKIASGEVLTYMKADKYTPTAYIPSNDAWGEMLEASGIKVETITDKLLGNTAGILLKKDVYDKVVEKYGEVNMKTVIEASLAGDLVFAYTNPYTSSTGLNILTAMLKAFDEDNPLSETAQQKLIDYQKQSPPVAYTTAVLRNQASKGIINAMVMEEQAYIMNPSLSDYVYIPEGIRHDHPVYTFNYATNEEKEVLKQFVDYCMKEENQSLGTKKGFNRHGEYVSQPSGLDGIGYLEAQKVWKQNKNGGKPVVAVFVADVSGSMGGTPLNSLKESLIAGSTYISSDNYIGLVSYSDNVTKNLAISKFDDTQRAYFAGEVKSLQANGGTATYNAILVATQMLKEAAENIPDAKLMLFVLTDGATNRGYNLDRISPIIAGMHIPVYSIAYNYNDDGSLQILSGLNEAVLINADSANIVNELRNLFNVET